MIKHEHVNGYHLVRPEYVKESDAKTIAKLMSETPGAWFCTLLRNGNNPDSVTNCGVVIRVGRQNRIIAFTTRFNVNDIFPSEIVELLRARGETFSFRIFLELAPRVVELTGWPMIVGHQFGSGRQEEAEYSEDWFTSDTRPAKRWWQFWR